jgi:putative transposase
MLRGLLAAEGCKVGRRHVKTLMRRMGIEALYRRPRTTKPEPGHKIYPYLLRGMETMRSVRKENRENAKTHYSKKTTSSG